MGIFTSIHDAIFGKAAAQPAPQTSATAPAAPAAPQPQPTQSVDVEAVLSAKPGADKLNWQTSIVDLMKLLGIDSSYEHRKELAGELGLDDYSGSAEDNIALHKATMQQVAEFGGKVPASMLA